ncbi:MAG: hypothetical protein ACLFPD_03775 [Desulfosudaceae bacterium]
MLMLDDQGYAVATRAACATGSPRASLVLMTIGLDHADAQGTLVAAISIGKNEMDVGQVALTLRQSEADAVLLWISPLSALRLAAAPKSTRTIGGLARTGYEHIGSTGAIIVVPARGPGSPR